MRVSKRIALAGISSAFGTIFLIAAVYVPFVDLSFMVMASLSLLLPISKNDFVGALLSFLSTSILGFLSTGNIILVLPYIIFFGLHPIIIAGLIKWRVPFILQMIIKIIFANIAILIAYFLLGLVINFGDFAFPYYLIAFAGTVFFIAYDWLIVRIKSVFEYLVDRFANRRKRK